MNHWDLTKKAWALARKKFPSVESLYVQVPDRFAASGECAVYDLRSPHAPIAMMKYALNYGGGDKAYVSLSIDDTVGRAKLLPVKSASVAVGSSRVQIGLPSAVLGAVMRKYQGEELCQAAALLGIGLKTAADKHPQRKFREYDKVRVVDDRSMEYQETGQILECKGTKRDGYWYLLLVDGSSKPVWAPEEALEPIMVGRLERRE